MIPERLPSVAADRMLAAWQELKVGEMTIPVEVTFDRPLDADRLARAFALALDAEPVAGCRFVAEGRRAVWERLAGPVGDAFAYTTDPGAFERFRTRFIDMFAGPQARALLLREPSGDRLLLHVSHAIADAGGTKHFVRVLSSIYRRLGGEPGFIPEPNLAGSRSIGQLFRELPLRAHPRILLGFCRETRNGLFPRFTHRFEPPVMEGGPMGFAVRHLPADRIADLAAFGHAKGATLNDLLMAAFVRAQIDVVPWDGRTQIRLQTTVDLRRYLPGRAAGGVCNLSAFDYFMPGTDPGGDYGETLERVIETTRRRKADWTGITLLCAAPMMVVLGYPALKRTFRRIFAEGIASHNQPNALTNLGPIAPGDVDFGVPPVRAWLLTPPINPPLFGLGLTGYAGTLTLSAGAPAGALPVIESFIDRIVAALP